jgi:hypothetical protein
MLRPYLQVLLIQPLNNNTFAKEAAVMKELGLTDKAHSNSEATRRDRC